MSVKKPKDYQLAETAYNEFYEQSPQIFFEQTSHDYQMKWVKVVRSVLKDYRELTPALEHKQVQTKAMKKLEKQLNGKDRRKFIIKDDKQKLADWKEADQNDVKVLQSNASHQKKINTVARMRWRDNQREKLGAERQDLFRPFMDAMKTD